MSLIDKFNADCPLTPKKLQEWLQTIITKFDVFTFDNIAIMQIIAKPQNTIINDVCSVDDFNAMFNAVKNGSTLKLVIDSSIYMVPTANVNEISDSDYKYVCFNFLGTFESLTGTTTFKHLKIGIEMLAGSIRLCDKSITDL